MYYSVLPNRAIPNQAKPNQTVHITTPGYTMLLCMSHTTLHLNLFIQIKKVIRRWCGVVGCGLSGDYRTTQSRLFNSGLNWVVAIYISVMAFPIKPQH